MSRLHSLRAELQDLTSLLGATASSGGDEWSPEWMAKQGMFRRQADLSHQISLLEGTAEVEIQLIGGAERRNEIDANFLGEFLQQLQQAVASIVQALMHGDQPRGPFPMDVLGSSTLHVGAAAPGSFIVQMSGPERNQQLTLDPHEAQPPFDEAIDRVLDLLQATGDGVDTDQLETAIAEIRSPRAIGHVQDLARSLARTGTSATITGRSPFGDEPREAEISARAAERLQEVLSRTKQETRRVFMTGQLSGVRWTKGIFDLEVPYGDEIVVINGRVSGDLRAAVSASFDRLVRAELEHTVTRTEFNEVPKDTYLLVGVTLVADDIPHMG